MQLTASKEAIHMLRYERCTCYYYFREKKCTMGTNKNAIKLSNKFVVKVSFKEKRVSPSNVWSIK